MPILRRNRRTNKEIENNIVTGMIVHDTFLGELRMMYKPMFFLSDYTRIISEWCVEYYDVYKKAPVVHIQDILNVEGENLDPALVRLIEKFLKKIDKEYVQEQNERINKDYLMDKTREYFKERSLSILYKKGQELLDAGKKDRAEELLAKHITIGERISGWLDPFDNKYIAQTFDNSMENVMFRFDGALGELIGNFERDQFIGIMGPMKRGKTFWLQEVAFQAVSERYNVIFFSLEMSGVQMGRRLFKRMTGLSEISGRKIVPIFDCKHNQNGTCIFDVRTNDITLYELIEDMPSYEQAPEGYEICTYCRDSVDPNYKGEYEAATWMTLEYQREKYTETKVRKKAKQIKTMVGKGRFKIKTYPAFSATVDDIRRDIDELEHHYNFVPDVVVLDYADIFASTRNDLSGREALDVIWKSLRGLAQEKHCLVVTATQTNRKAIEKGKISQIDTAEDIRKVAHVDKMFGLNQTKSEKRRGVMRINMIANRHEDYDEAQTVYVLQNYDRGLPILDSEWKNDFF